MNPNLDPFPGLNDRWARWSKVLLTIGAISAVLVVVGLAGIGRGFGWMAFVFFIPMLVGLIMGFGLGQIVKTRTRQLSTMSAQLQCPRCGNSGHWGWTTCTYCGFRRA